jgi:hypothetical protein
MLTLNLFLKINTAIGTSLKGCVSRIGNISMGLKKKAVTRGMYSNQKLTYHIQSLVRDGAET